MGSAYVKSHKSNILRNGYFPQSRNISTMKINQSTVYIYVCLSIFFNCYFFLSVIKTGSSGLIAYRWLTKEFRWIWLQSSCKVIYKNSKPDFVICTHRQLT